MLSKTKLSILALTVVGILLLGACKQGNVVDQSVSLTIKATSEDGVADFSPFTVELKELRTLKTTTKQLDSQGSCSVVVDKGSYTINISWRDGNVSYFGTKENLTVTASETITIPVIKSISQPVGLIFKEIFFNGETNNGRMMHPDQYFVLYNNGEETVYADGITFAVSLHANWNEADEFTALLPNEIVAAQFYSIPGNGTQHPVAPGEQIVIARTAINHSETYENAVDLSGADFEIYEPDMPSQYGTDVNNPDVPDLIAHFSVWGIFNMHPRGPLAPFIFKPDTDMATFMENNKFEFKTSQGETKFAYKVPATLIMDGIETGNEGAVKVKSLPPSVDQGVITVTGCHRQELIQRKKGANGKLLDTNNSTNDCERVKGQNSFPKKTPQGVRMAVPKTTKTYYTEFPSDINHFENSSWNVLK